MVHTFVAACTALVVGWVGCGALLASAPAEHMAQYQSTSSVA
jgi:hypothetical protein